MEDEVKKLMSSRAKGEAWVEKALPVVVGIARTIKELEGKKAEDSIFPKSLLKEVSDTYDPSIKAMKEVDSKVRARIIEEHGDNSPVAMMGVGELVFPMLWVFEVTDINKVDRKYLVIDSAAVREDIKKGVRNIKGITIKQNKTLQVRPHTEKASE